MAAQPPEEDLRERPIGDLVKQLADQTSTLVRQELDLAKAEVTQQGKEAGKAIGMLAGGAVVALLGAGTLVAFLVMLLDGAIPNWLAALIVAVVLLALAAGLVLAGRNRLRRATPPAQQTVETVKEDVQWAKTRTRSAQR
ncbi:MAG TPA: phage holin family protein [Solirubrobacteraceae bacterium]|jgi:MFS family permease